MAIDIFCPLCNIGSETISHLFFECDFTAYVWNSARTKLLLPTNNHLILSNELMLITQTFKSKDSLRDLARLALSVTVWLCWKERNIRIFGGNTSNKETLAKQTDFYIGKLMTKSNKIQSISPNYNDIRKNWSLPETPRVLAMDSGNCHAQHNPIIPDSSINYVADPAVHCKDTTMHSSPYEQNARSTDDTTVHSNTEEQNGDSIDNTVSMVYSRHLHSSTNEEHEHNSLNEFRCNQQSKDRKQGSSNSNPSMTHTEEQNSQRDQQSTRASKGSTHFILGSNIPENSNLCAGNWENIKNNNMILNAIDRNSFFNMELIKKDKCVTELGDVANLHSANHKYNIFNPNKLHVEYPTNAQRNQTNQQIELSTKGSNSLCLISCLPDNSFHHTGYRINDRDKELRNVDKTNNITDMIDPPDPKLDATERNNFINTDKSQNDDPNFLQNQSRHDSSDPKLDMAERNNIINTDKSLNQSRNDGINQQISNPMFMELNLEQTSHVIYKQQIPNKQIEIENIAGNRDIPDNKDRCKHSMERDPEQMVDLVRNEDDCRRLFDPG